MHVYEMNGASLNVQAGEVLTDCTLPTLLIDTYAEAAGDRVYTIRP